MNVKTNLFFSKISIGKTYQSTPWTTDVANHAFARIVRDAGLNSKGTLYSFIRNFAITINDNLSKETASSLIGHSPYSHVLKKCYAGDFEQMDMTELIQKGERTFTPTMSPLLKPHAYRIADIRK
ncbi:unnamed protein product [Rhizopus microsporus]|nr:hypothetical protein RMCBS344292_15883 [Rhizopus microsporus]